MIARLKAWGAFLAGIAVAFIGLLAGWQTAARERERRQQAEAGREVERRAARAAVEGERRINEARAAPVDTRRRDHFERD